MFGRYGLANSRFNQIKSAVSGGVVFTNPFSNLEDNIGLAFSRVNNSDEFQMQKPSRVSSETAIEFTYSLPIKEWLLIQPDVQYIINSGLSAEIDNALSVALLVQFSISY